jgi:hypothetical protein
MGVHGHTRAFILLSTPADAGTVLRRALRLTSSLCCAIVADAASRLTSPFSSIVPTHNVWVMHCLGAVFALIVYGIGLGWVARFSDGRPV